MFDAELALEIAKLERLYGCPIWQTKDKRLIPITQMEASHLYRSWRYMINAASKAKSDANYEKAMIRLTWLQEEFRARKLSYESKEFEELIEKNRRDIRTYYDLDRDMDEGNDPFMEWWYMGDKD